MAAFGATNATMRSTEFWSEQEALLARIVGEHCPPARWPDGCYGSGLPWLTFVGPSPGGGDGTEPEVPRQEETEVPLWNEDFTHPCEQWSPGFRVSTKVLVETIIGRTRDQGAMKLYSFANFDWIQNPNAADVPEERMARGAPLLLRHLSCTRPRVIVTLETRAHTLLTQVLSADYRVRRTRFGTVRVLWMQTSRGPRYHRSIDAYALDADGPLCGRFVIRSPQHPARILNASYALRVARAVRQVLVCLADGTEPIEVICDA